MKNFIYRCLERILEYLKDYENSLDHCPGFCDLTRKMVMDEIMSSEMRVRILDIMSAYRDVLVQKEKDDNPISKTDSEAIENIQVGSYFYPILDWESREKFLVALIKRYKRIEVVRNETNKL